MNNIKEFLYRKNKSSCSMAYSEILSRVQQYIAKEQSEALFLASQTEDAVALLKHYILDYVVKQGIFTDTCDSVEELAERLYEDMAGYSFLTGILKKTDIEEININSWEDTEVVAKVGYKKLQTGFVSSMHSVDVTRRMLAVSGMVLDDTSPIALGHLSKNIRIAAIKSPIVDEDVGVAASIRIVNPDKLTTEQLLKSGAATLEMLDFLRLCIRYGVSVCFAGSTGSGKTTAAGWLLSTIPYNKRIFTIEDGSRELDLVVRDKGGKALNRVISTKTRISDNPKYRITQDDLLDVALRFHPDVIVVGEMRGEEAFTAQEAARTGHTVATTIHSNSCESTYRRMMTLAKRKYNMSDDTLMGLMVEAFPIIAYCHQLEDGSRKITEITEAEGYHGGKLVYRSLFRFFVNDNTETDGRVKVNGHFERGKGISDMLYNAMLRNGAPKAAIAEFREV
jgi:pilus assembly protein CpaF